MRLSFSLSQRFLFFVAATIALMLLGSFFVSSYVIRNELSKQLEAQFERARISLDHHADVLIRSRMGEILTALRSPRLLAALETGDPLTIAAEAPTYRELLKADLLAITNSDSTLLYLSSPGAQALVDTTASGGSAPARSIALTYQQVDSTLYHVYAVAIVTTDGYRLGSAYIGSEASDLFAAQLQKLTDFDVLITQDTSVCGATRSQILTALMRSREFERFATADIGKVLRREFEDDEIMTATLPLPDSKARVTFVASIDERISPLLREILYLLTLLSIVGGCVAMALIYLFTQRSIVRQVNQLVSATGRIADGNLGFTVEPLSRDELGTLAAKIEQMRSRLLENRTELEKAHASTLASDRLATIGKLATGIIHDFKNPMAVVRATTDLVRLRTKENEKIATYCDTIHRQVDAMVELTRDVLEYSRGRSKLNVAPVSLDQYFQSIQEFHKAQFAEAAIRLTVTPPHEIALNIDQARLRRVIDNLLNNAREACVPGDEVTLDCRVSNSDAVLRIADTGPGIPKQLVADIFEPFVTDGKEGGTGLGLAIARRIVEDHGASISVESVSGKGTCFTILFPLSAVVATEPRLVTA